MIQEYMNISIIDPTVYPNWDRLVLGNAEYSFFHTSEWAKALIASYRFKPLYFVVLEEGHLVFLMPLMEVNSFLTGKRGVSLPFTDQCRLHILKEDLFKPALQSAIDLGHRRHWKFIEWRDAGHFDNHIPASELFYVHDVDLTRGAQELYSSLSDNNRRNIKKAYREKVVVNIEKSIGSIENFYKLNVITRQRHGLPPQPLAFFRSVFNYIISTDYGMVASATYQGRIIAASVFFHFGKRALYKYGASDTKYQHVRPNNLIMWEALRWYHEQGFETMSLGRTELNNDGLLQFKRTWGAKESLVKYHLYDIKRRDYAPKQSRNRARFEGLFARTPTPVLRMAGRFLYRHVA